jgi:Lipocalin-like domain
MNRRAIAIRLFATLLFLTGPLSVSSTFAQGKSLKDQIIGTWALVSFDSFNSAGAKVPVMEGSDLKGRLFLTADGLLSVQILAEYPKLASKNRLKTTAAEDRAVAHGVLSFFGTYTVNEADKLIIFHIERSSFPNQATGKGAKRTVTISGDELRLGSPGQATGGQRRFVIVWRRIK